MITVINKKLNKQIRHNIPSALVPYCLTAFNNIPIALKKKGK